MRTLPSSTGLSCDRQFRGTGDQPACRVVARQRRLRLPSSYGRVRGRPRCPGLNGGQLLPGPAARGQLKSWHTATERVASAAEERAIAGHELAPLGRLARGRRAEIIERIDQVRAVEQQVQADAGAAGRPRLSTGRATRPAPAHPDPRRSRRARQCACAASSATARPGCRRGVVPAPRLTDQAARPHRACTPERFRFYRCRAPQGAGPRRGGHHEEPDHAPGREHVHEHEHQLRARSRRLAGSAAAVSPRPCGPVVSGPVGYSAAVGLEQPQPDLADRREARDRVPQPVDRHLGRRRRPSPSAAVRRRRGRRR